MHSIIINNRSGLVLTDYASEREEEEEEEERWQKRRPLCRLPHSISNSQTTAEYDEKWALE